MNITTIGENDDKQRNCSSLFSYGYARARKWQRATSYYNYYLTHPLKWKGWVKFFFFVKFVIEIPSIIMVLKPLHAPPSFSVWECGRGIFFWSKFIGSTFRLCILLFLEFVSFYANFNTGIQLYPHLVFLFFYLFVQYLHLVFYYFFFMCNTLVLCYNFLSIYAIFSLFRE
jgi:hypothetical protein